MDEGIFEIPEFVAFDFVFILIVTIKSLCKPRIRLTDPFKLIKHQNRF